MSPQVSSNQEKCSIQHFMELDSDNSIYIYFCHFERSEKSFAEGTRRLLTALGMT
jgi:transposase